MNKFLVAGSLLIALSACASAPPSNPWDDLEVDTGSAVRPYPLPDRPDVIVTPDGLLLDREAVETLDDYFIIAEGNTDIAEAHAAQVNELRAASASLIEAGRAQRQQAEILRATLQDTRRQCVYEKASLYALILIGLGASTL